MSEGALLRTDHIEPDITVVVLLAGKLVMGRDPLHLEDLVADLVRRHRRKIILNLTQVYYIDSSGLGSIARCLSIRRRAGGELRVAGAADKVKELFHTTRLDTALSFYPTVPEASRDFQLP
jgi:anti-sigma B factor antagonist